MNQNSVKQWPTVSFLIPTLNAEEFLKKCLLSIKTLDYNPSLVEVVIADGGSTDSTIQVARSFKYKIVRNPRKTTEYGKRVAFDASNGEFIVLLDADNVIASKDWLTKLIKPLVNNPGIFGAESDYLINHDFTSLNSYAALAVIVDPLARIFAEKPKIKYEDHYETRTFPQGTVPISGANGFIWRRDKLKKYLRDSTELNEVMLLFYATQESDIKLVFYPGVGIFHYYCENLIDYIGKRKKIISHYLKRKNTETMWTTSVPRGKKIFAIIYLATLVGPTFEAFINVLKSKNLNWFWHPLISFLTIAIYSFYFAVGKRRGI